MRPPRVMISYQSADGEAVRLLHDELALRGMRVLWDRETFGLGERLESEMARAVDDCDAFVVYLTPASLYLDRPDLPHKPVIDDELRAAMQRRRNQLAARGGRSRASVVKPIIFPIAHGLGDPRTEATERVREVSGEDLSSLWTPITIDQSTPRIQPQEAADIARTVLRSLLPPGGEASETPVEITVCSRGTRQGGGALNLDATPLLGGGERRPGSPESWQRFLAALRDVETMLKAHSPNRQIRFRLGLHLSGAMALGRVFHQAAGWRLAIEGRHGVARLSEETSSDVRQVWDPGSSSTDEATLELELLPHPVRSMASDLIASLPQPPRGRLHFWRDSREDLRPAELAALSKSIARRTQQICGEKDVRRLHVFCASPVELAVLLGHQLTGMEVDLQLYERNGDRYVRSLLLPRATP